MSTPQKYCNDQKTDRGSQYECRARTRARSNVVLQPEDNVVDLIFII